LGENGVVTEANVVSPYSFALEIDFHS